MELLLSERVKHSNQTMAGDLPVEDKSQLVDYFEAGCKPPTQFRLGLEQEMFVIHKADHRPAAYDGPEPGIRALLEGMTRFGWEPIHENGRPIALTNGSRSMTLEPGGQVELSGAPLDNAHDTEAESRGYFQQIAAVADELDLCFLAIGHRPKCPRREVPWMPKARYRIMRDYMAKQGPLGQTMMQSTCSLQSNHDFSSEAVLSIY
jgi:glutamate--cysteine ligase